MLLIFFCNFQTQILKLQKNSYIKSFSSFANFFLNWYKDVLVEEFSYNSFNLYVFHCHEEQKNYNTPFQKEILLNNKKYLKFSLKLKLVL